VSFARAKRPGQTIAKHDATCRNSKSPGAKVNPRAWTGAEDFLFFEVQGLQGSAYSFFNAKLHRREKDIEYGLERGKVRGEPQNESIPSAPPQKK